MLAVVVMPLVLIGSHGIRNADGAGQRDEQH
jgi:hypothetical protein